MFLFFADALKGSVARTATSQGMKRTSALFWTRATPAPLADRTPPTCGSVSVHQVSASSLVYERPDFIEMF